LFIWTGGHVSLRVVNVTWINLDSLSFILHFLNQFELQVGRFVVSVKATRGLEPISYRGVLVSTLLHATI
jgi:hypothetical protein